MRRVCPFCSKEIPRKKRESNARSAERYTWRGETLTVSEWAAKLGFQRHALYYRLNNWRSIDDVFTRPATHGGQRRASVLTWNGRTQSVREWAAELGITARRMRTRYRTWPPELAFAPKQKGGTRPIFITWQGKGQTLKEWSQETGIALPTLHKRYRLKWSVDDLLGLPVGGRKRVEREPLEQRAEARRRDREGRKKYAQSHLRPASP